MVFPCKVIVLLHLVRIGMFGKYFYLLFIYYTNNLSTYLDNNQTTSKIICTDFGIKDRFSNYLVSVRLNSSKGDKIFYLWVKER